jgi:acyl carrier protein
MPALEQTSTPTASIEQFELRVLHFINQTLPQLDRRRRTRPPVSVSTPLFASGLLDSLSILHLIAAIEEFTGRAVPDQLVVMKHFQTVEAMSAAFS